MITNMINNKKTNPIVTELFIRDRKLNFFIVFITQSYFKVPKEVHFFLLWRFPVKENLNKLQ